MSSSSSHSVAEVFLAFLKLGLTSFGGPIAHLAYFRTEFVERRKWLDEHNYSDLVALCQFLPGPASSKVGIGLGLRRAGWLGAVAAWVGFTAPSAMALIAFAYGMQKWAALSNSGALHGLKVIAVAVVAQAVWGMAKSLCPDRERAGLAIGAAVVALLISSSVGQVLAIVLGAVVGLIAVRPSGPPVSIDQGYGVSKRTGAVLLLTFVALLIGLPVAAAHAQGTLIEVVAAFYRAGALVFGGGHVVLPMLEASVVQPGWVSNDAFLAGYGAAQAVPGPLFTFAAYLGASMNSPIGGWFGGLVALIAVFAPGFLLVIGAIPFWEGLRHNTVMRRATAGVNAAVVGVLAAALYDPVWTSAIHSKSDLAFALVAYALLVFGRVSPVFVVLLASLVGTSIL
ncbi:MAG: chromate efflux transporter [Hydrogenophaga sp.]|uniref:chromate efflux transporter n=2 Tax=Hydrogenophaga sp. TaxID=1904254 RepID=UPI0040365BE0